MRERERERERERDQLKSKLDFAFASFPYKLNYLDFCYNFFSKLISIFFILFIKHNNL